MGASVVRLFVVLLVAGLAALSTSSSSGAPVGDVAVGELPSPFHKPQVATYGNGTWLVAYSDYTVGTVDVARTSDFGRSWSKAGSFGGQDQSPTIAMDDQGNGVLAFDVDTYGQRDIVVSRSANGGLTWSAPTPVALGTVGDGVYDRSPTIAQDSQGNWLVAWGRLDDPFDPTMELAASLSTDFGATWSAPVFIGAGSGPDSLGLPITLASDGAGNWMLAYLEGSAIADWELVVRRSFDNGSTWSSPTQVNTGGTPGSPYDYTPDLASDGAGNWMVVWTKDSTSFSFDERLFVARSSDVGQTWTAPLSIAGGPLPDSYRGERASVEATSAGQWAVMWTEGNSILVSQSVDNGNTWSVGTNGTPGTHLLEVSGPGVVDGPAQNPDFDVDSSGRWMTAWGTSGGASSECNPFGADSDIDHVPDVCDNCPATYNNSQKDWDSDWLGGACDPDDDADGVPDASDQCLDTAIGAVIDSLGCSDAQADPDGDGVCTPGKPGGPGGCTGSDNCAFVANASQLNPDNDAWGSACDYEGPSPNNRGLGGANDCTDGVDNDGDSIVDGAEASCGPAIDSDGDGFTDPLEAHIGTNPASDCSVTNTTNDEPTDAHPLDTNDDRIINSIDIGSFVPRLNKNAPDPAFNRRWDLNGDVKINTVDIGRYVVVLNDNCRF